MPPWKPEGGPERFADVRRLSAEQISTFRQWFENATPEGKQEDLPKPPNFAEGWLLGEPDLVLQMPETYQLPAGGADVFRSFVIPIPLEGIHYVRGLECRPSNAQVIHHADIVFDPTGQSRELDALDNEPGFDGMRPIESATVGHLTGWAPGGTPILYPEDMAWNLDPSSDLVLTLHMLPTGKPEQVDFQLGFHFTDKRPKRPSYLLRLASTTIDIPAGTADYDVIDQFELPVDVEAVGIRPHAHYLGKTIDVSATLPGGLEETLLRIEDWDFNWQDDYRYRKPLLLPKGTQLRMRWSFDNSAENVRNPNSPPQPVAWGADSSDEMALALLQVVPFNASEYRQLAMQLQEKGFLDKISGYEAVIRREPDNVAAHNSLSYYYSIAPEPQAIADRLEGQRRDSPDDIATLYCLGLVHSAMGDDQKAIKHFDAALQIRDDYHIARYQYAVGLLAIDRIELAISALKQFIEVEPNLPNAHAALGTALKRAGRLEQAVEALKRSVELSPELAENQEQLGLLQAELGNWTDAELQFRTLVESGHRTTETLVNLGVALQKQGRHADAIETMKQALQIDQDSWQLHANLAALHIELKDANAAIHHYQQALRIKPDAWPVRMKFGELWLLVGEPDKAADQFVEVAASNPNAADVHLKAAQTLKTAGRFDDAMTHYELAIQVRPNWMPAEVGRAWLLATHPRAEARDAKEAVRIASSFVESDNPHPIALDTFAAASAASGDFERAVEYASRAVTVARAAGLNGLADRIQDRLNKYQSGEAHREEIGPPE